LSIINKSFVLYIFFFSLPNLVQSQSSVPGINFQAIARDAANNPANTRKIYVKATIENGFPDGTIVYGDQHEVYTNEYGVFHIAIGKGQRFAGAADLYQINWSQNLFYIHLKIAITPVTPNASWDYTKEWIDIGTAQFGVVPYALHSFTTSAPVIDTSIINNKVNVSDTTNMLLPYKVNSTRIDSIIQTLFNVVRFNDSNRIYVTPFQLSQYKFDTAALIAAIHLKLNSADTVSLSNRINTKELLANKSINVNNVQDYNNDRYPSVKAIKDYVDAALTAGAPDATTTNKGILLLAGDLSGTASIPSISLNAITTNKLQDAAVTDAKLAYGINPAKVGLGNVSNQPQLYNLNGLTAQVQSFAAPSITGLAPNWISSSATHTLNIPMASASAVTAGLISKLEYDQFSLSYSNRINSVTNIGNNGLAYFNGNVLNIPAYSLVGLAGTVNPNSIFAGPSSGGNGSASFRQLVAADIPNNAANTTGNSYSASKLLTARYINNVLFDGTADISGVTANTNNAITFKNDGLGASAGAQFNGSAAKDISYNTIGAAPANGSTDITTLGSISAGSWAANVIGANYGGAGNNNGILKANGSGIVSAAVSGTDYLAPFGTQTSKYIYAAPNSGNGNPSFRLLLGSDIPVLNQNTTGNAATASSLLNSVFINGVSFNGTSDININANTANPLSFSDNGNGGAVGTQFNGTAAKDISYNTIGAAPAIGSNAITNLGTISSGTWAANIIGSNYGGAGANNGMLKANGNGVVSVAISGTDYQSPLSFSSPLLNTANTITIPSASNNTNGYLTSNDWNSFNNKIDLSQKAALNGVASLDGNGKIPASQIPSISFSSGYVVTSQTEMLALSSAVVGSIAIRTDNSKNYVLSGLPATTLSNWLELLMPVSVSSVNGHTESNITLTTTDIAEGTRTYFTNTRARDAINATAPIVYTASTGNISMASANTSTPGYITASDWNTFNNKIGAFTSQSANTFYAGPTTGINALPSFRSIAVVDVPTLNQNTTGNAATATKLAATKNINGVAFDGSADIIISSSVLNGITFDNTGSTSTTVVFNGSISKTVSYNTIGAAPAAGSSSITTLGSITSGTWLANVIDANHGGAGAVNGVLKANGNGVVTAASIGTDYLTPFGSQTKNYFYAAPNGVDGTPIFRALLAADVPILNQATTANAGTATKLAATKTINGVPFDGSSNINIYAPVPSPITFDDSGTGALTTATFNGSVAKTISYNTIGAAPALGSNAITTVGSITTGTWLGSIIDANHGGAGNINGILKANGSGTVSAATSGTDFEVPLTFSTPLIRSANTVSMAAATSTANGYLTSSDWTLFNSKQATILAGTGVTITGGNTVSIGQSVATTANPNFATMTLSGLNVAGIVTNTAGGLLGTATTTGSGNIVRANTPTLITPVLGEATATSIVAGTITSTGDMTAKRYKLTMPSNIIANATTNIDLGAGNVFTVVLNTSITSLTVTNQAVGTYLIKFVQDATGLREVAFPTGWKWAGGIAPTLTDAGGKLDIVTLIYDGTNYYATIVKNF
jgi:hypothetical protein